MLKQRSYFHWGIVIFLLCAVAGLASFTVEVFADEWAMAGYGGSNLSGSPTQETFTDCSLFPGESGSGNGIAKCPHWVRASVSTFVQAFDRMIGSYKKDSAYYTCVDENDSGEVIFAGYYNKDNELALFNRQNWTGITVGGRNRKMDYDAGWYGYNLEDLIGWPGNTWSGYVQYCWDKSTNSALGTWCPGGEGYIQLDFPNIEPLSYDFFSEEIPGRDGYTYRDLMWDVGADSNDSVAFFCQGMEDVDPPEEPVSEYHMTNFDGESVGWLDGYGGRVERDGWYKPVDGIINAACFDSYGATWGEWEECGFSSISEPVFFRHTVMRVDGDYDIYAASTYYRIQESYDGGASWGDVSGYGTSGSIDLYPYESRDMEVYSAIDISRYSAEVIVYCQRIQYDPWTYYIYEPGNSFAFSGDGAYSVPACVTVWNPDWEEYSDSVDYTVEIEPETIASEWSADFSGVGKQSFWPYSYQATEVSGGMKFNHRLTRYDEGFEALDCYGVLNCDWNRRGDVTGIGTVSTQYWGNYGWDNYYPSGFSGWVSLDSHGDSWSSKDWGSGYTEGAFDSGLRAGQTKDFCQKTKNSPSKFTKEYKDVFVRVSSYGKPDGWFYDNFVDNNKYYVGTESVWGGVDESGTGASAEKCVSVERKWSYDVTEISVSNGTESGNHTLVSGGTMSGVEVEVTVKDDRNGWLGVDGISRNYMTGINTSRTSFKWVKFVVNKDTVPTGDMMAGGDMNGWSGCGYWRNKLGGWSSVPTCDDIESVTISSGDIFGDMVGVIAERNGDTSTSVAVPLLEVGQKYCVAVFVERKSSTSNESLMSRASCGDVSKNPSVHVLGGSVGAQGGVAGKITTVDVSSSSSKTFGSWTDLAVIANGKAEMFASGDALPASGGVTRNCDISPITIANGDENCTGLKDEPGKAGIDTLANAKTLVYDALKNRYVNGAVHNCEVDGTPSGNVVYCNGNMTIKEHDVVVDMDSYITGLDDIPQVILIAEGNVVIEHKVGRVDALILAGGTVDTCGGLSLADSNNVTTCERPLRINGQIFAQKINFKRTYGGDYTMMGNTGMLESGAEEINYGTWIYLFGANETKAGGTTNVVYQRKLPPRY